MCVKYTIENIKIRMPLDSRLTILNFGEPKILKNGVKDVTVVCRCSCGNIKTILARSVLSVTMSCGCINKAIAKSLYTHKRPPSIYPRDIRTRYYSMMSRCYDKNDKSYKNYGGKGVVVCDEWKNDINTFCQWVLKNNWDKSLELDKDIKGDGYTYGPNSCCFVTQLENNHAQKKVMKLLYNGKQMVLPDIAKFEGISYPSLKYGIDRGYDLDLIIRKAKNNKYGHYRKS